MNPAKGILILTLIVGVSLTTLRAQKVTPPAEEASPQNEERQIPVQATTAQNNAPGGTPENEVVELDVFRAC